MKKTAILACAMLGVAALMWVLGLGPGSSPANAQVSPREGLLIQVEIDGISGFFTEVSGLGSESEIVEHKFRDASGAAGGATIRKIPGRLKWQDITLKRGIVSSNLELWEWRKVVEDGVDQKFRKNGSVTILDQFFEPVARWNFSNAWPSKVSGPTFKSDSNEFGVETMILTHEGIERLK